MLLRYAVFLGFVLAVAIGLSFVPVHGASTVAVTRWEYRSTDEGSREPIEAPATASPPWTAIELPGHPAAPLTGMLWMRAKLPDQHFADAALAVDAVTSPFEIWLDGARIHAHPDPEGVATRAPPGVPWHLVRLPAGYEGKTILFRVRPDYRPMGIKGTPTLGERADLLEDTLARDLPRLVVGLLTILIGLLASASLFRREDRRLVLGYAVAMTTLGAYLVHYTHVKDRLLDAPRAWFVLWLLTLPLNTAGATAFLDGLFGTGPKGALHRTHRIALGLCVAVPLIDALAAALYASPGTRLAGVMLFGGGLLVVRLFLVAASVVAMVVVGRLARAGDVDARIFLFGFLFQTVMVFRDLLAAFGVGALAWRSQLHLGTLILVLSLTLLLQRRYLAAGERAARYGNEVALRTREKERFLRDLHDGVGGLTSNVRMLAELGKGNDARARAALETIAELSKESLAELRLFVRALDEGQGTWGELAAELRRFGAQLAEPTGRSFAMDIQVEREGQPDGHVRLNLLRIFREAVTNALKQRDSKAITATLRVSPAELHLVVANDGGDGARDAVGIDAGRGVSHMRARAEEIGGELVLRPGSRTEVELWVPKKPPGGAREDALRAGGRAPPR